MIDFEKILTAKGKTKADLARFLEIEPNNVNRTIRNERIPLSKIESICEWAGISIIDAFRLSGYDDTPGVAADYAKILEEASDTVADALLKMFADKQIAPYRVVEEKEEEIGRLNREIGRLEGIIEENGLDAWATVGKKIFG